MLWASRHGHFAVKKGCHFGNTCCKGRSIGSMRTVLSVPLIELVPFVRGKNRRPFDSLFGFDSFCGFHTPQSRSLPRYMRTVFAMLHGKACTDLEMMILPKGGVI